MKLLPSLKQKKRYIVFQVLTKEKLRKEDLEKAVEKALLRFLGELGMAKASPILVKEKFKGNMFIVKVNHTWVDEVKAALILVDKINTTAVVIKSIITSGTLKKAASYLQ